MSAKHMIGRGKVRDMNWRYAVGEVLLIVVGVSIALAASAWYENRATRIDEVEILVQLREALVEDLGVLVPRMNDVKLFESNANKLFQHLDAELPYDESLTPYLGNLNGFRTVRIRTAPFEALKSRGLHLISNEGLRMRLVSLYQDELENLIKNVDIDAYFVRERISPYFLGNFRRTGDELWVPKDYDAIVAEYYVANVARYRSFTLKNFTIPSIDRTLALMQEIVADIDAELGHAPGK